MANVTGGAGADTLSGTTGSDSIAGFAGADTITAGIGNDSIYGGGGNDTVAGDDGNDLIFGDRDLASVWGYRVYDRNFTSANGQAFTIETGTLRGSGLTTGFDVTNLALAARGTTGDPNDFGVIMVATFTATTAGTYRFTTTSDDGSTLRLLDGSGNALNFANQTGGTLGYLNNDFHQSAATRFGDVTLAAGQSYTIEIRFWENQGQNTLAATVTPPGGTAVNLANSIYIGSPNATNSGNDVLSGGAGLDTIFGEAGNDTLNGDAGTDSLSGGDGDDRLFGGTENDTLAGDAGADSLFGGDGTDSLLGGDGDDIIDGGDRSDSVFGGVGNDLITDTGGATSDDTLFGGDGNDTISGGLREDLIGGDTGDDQLSGDAGNDTLQGGDGNDRLTGGDGADILIGGGDQDIFFVGVGDVVDGSETGVDFDTLDLREYGKARTEIIFGGGNNEAGTVRIFDTVGNETGTLGFSNIENVIPCFTPGTMIATDRGEMRVENLRAGDLVMTRDHGPRPLRWTGRRDLDAADLMAMPALRPVLIPAGALGAGMPRRDMMVSPQHRMLIAGAVPEMLFGTHEVLVAAIHLVGRGGIVQATVPAVSYVHLLCDAHEIICADGAWSESFQPAARMIAGMAPEARQELLALFPDLARGLAFPAARPSLRAHEAQVMIAA
jgi:serralysin